MGCSIGVELRGGSTFKILYSSHLADGENYAWPLRSPVLESKFSRVSRILVTPLCPLESQRLWGMILANWCGSADILLF